LAADDGRITGRITGGDICLKPKRNKAIAVLTGARRGVYSSAIRFGVPERYVFAFRPTRASLPDKSDPACITGGGKHDSDRYPAERKEQGWKPCMRW
jgi:hypothetical protein